MDILSALTAGRAAHRTGRRCGLVRSFSACGPAPGQRAANPVAAALDNRGRHPARPQELTKCECFGLLAREQLGRVTFVDDLGPMVLPVNFVLDRQMVVFRTGNGAKLDVARSGGRVAFEIDGADVATHTGWSVVVRGEAVEVTDPAELTRLRRLPLAPWAPGTKRRYVRILPAVLTGRRISLPARRPARVGVPPPAAPAPDDESRPWEQP
jgi:uncharacterized protein